MLPTVLYLPRVGQVGAQSQNSLSIACPNRHLLYSWHSHARSLGWGLSIKGSTLKWWRPVLLRLFDRFQLCRFFSQAEMLSWIMQG